MSDAGQDKITKSMARYIRGSRKSVTILFTDIEDSTKHWDRHGDIEGRLIIDQHNRLLFPVIAKFDGKIIKTIGDAIMASFKKPAKAVRAAIAMQQFLRQEKQRDPDFQLKVRIGIHTGEAIVEQNDIFGDAVNVASRVEQFGNGNDIIVSKSTVAKIRKKDFTLVDKAEFTPRGKQAPLTVYQCKWEKHPDLISNINRHPFLMVLARQKTELLLYLSASLGGLSLLYAYYGRFGAAYLQNLMVTGFSPVLFSFAMAALLFIIVFAGRALLRMETFPHLFLSSLCGGCWACVGFVLVFMPLTHVPDLFPSGLGREVFSCKQKFVEILEDNVSVRERHYFYADVLEKVQEGRLLFLQDEAVAGKLVWNKVPIGRDSSGWVVRAVPAKIGVPMKIVSRPVKFVFRIRDAAALLAGLGGFAWGFFAFKIRPA